MISKNFTKKHLTFDEQITLLESRRLIINDKDLARKKLKELLNV